MKTIEDIMTSMVRNNYLTVANLELDAFSYPLPDREGGKTVERFFLYPNQPQTRKLRPYAWVIIDTDTGAAFQYNRCEYFDFAAGLQVPMEQSLDYSVPAKCDYKEMRSMQREFAAIYAKIREFAFCDGVTDGQKEMLSRYMGLQKKLINPEIMPFYRLLSPAFYEWAEKETGEL